jgi:nucleoside-diphosphate-sugar epimerase
MHNMNKIFLTGCSGYIGRTLVPYLKLKGYCVLGFDRKPYPAADLDDFIQDDLLDSVLLHRSLDKIDTIIHLAAAKDDWGLSDQEYYHDNVTATRALLKAGASAGIKRWVFFSSVAVMGSSSSPLDESAPIAPTNAYGRSKAEAEILFQQFARRDSSASILIVRPSVVFGPGNPTNTNVYRLIDAIYHNKFVMVGKGDTIKSTSYIENLIASTLFLINRMQQGGHTFIYVDEPSPSTADIIHQICRLLRKRPPRWHIPLSVATPLAYLADIVAAVTRKDFPITAARIKKFCRQTNFTARGLRNLGFEQPVPIEEGLRCTVQWYLTLKGTGATAKMPEARDPCVGHDHAGPKVGSTG